MSSEVGISSNNKVWCCSIVVECWNQKLWVKYFSLFCSSLFLFSLFCRSDEMFLYSLSCAFFPTQVNAKERERERSGSLGSASAYPAPQALFISFRALSLSIPPLVLLVQKGTFRTDLPLQLSSMDCLRSGSFWLQPATIQQFQVHFGAYTKNPFYRSFLYSTNNSHVSARAAVGNFFFSCNSDHRPRFHTFSVQYDDGSRRLENEEKKIKLKVGEE